MKQPAIKSPPAAPSSAVRRGPAIRLGAAAALIVCALPAVYLVAEDRGNVVEEEKVRMSRVAERTVGLVKTELTAGRDPAAAFGSIAQIATPYVSGVSIALMSTEGRILAHAPTGEGYVGKDVSGGETFRHHLARREKISTLLTTSAVDGAVKVFATGTVADGASPPLYVVVNRDLTATMAAWRRRTLLEAAQMVCVVAAVLFFAGMAARREKKLQDASDEIARREAMYHNLFRGNKAAMLLIDPSCGDIVDANDAAAEFYGYGHDRLTRLRIGDLNILSPDEIAAEMAAAKAESRSHFLFRHRLASGEIRDVEVHSGPVQRDGKGLLYSIVHDVTARRLLETERARLLTAIEQSPASIVITDVKGDIRYVNPAFTRVSGYAPEEVIGQNPRILKSGHTSDAEYAELWDAISSGRSHSAVFHNKRKDGGFYWEHAHISPVFDDTGRIVDYVGIKENISDLKKAEDELRAANERLERQAAKLRSVNAELEQFAYVASHDLRQPLRAISSYLQLIDKTLGCADVEVREYISFAVGGARRLDQLIVGLLEYSRIGRLSRPAAPVSFGELAETARLTFSFALEEAGGKLEIAPDLPTIVGDETELRRLLDNLIGNAVKYRSPDRPLRVKVGGETRPDAVVVWVADNGSGIAQEDHERAFAMFQRLGPRDACEGAGIGLAVCKKIVERHHGRIRIESTPGEGCRFVMTFTPPEPQDAA